MISSLTFCPNSTWQLIKIDDELHDSFSFVINKGVTEDDAIRAVFDSLVMCNTSRVCLYRTFVEEYSFSVEKMKAFVKCDAMVRFVVKDLMSKGHDEEYALLLTFNGYVIEDSLMRNVYKELG